MSLTEQGASVTLVPLVKVARRSATDQTCPLRNAPPLAGSSKTFMYPFVMVVLSIVSGMAAANSSDCMLTSCGMSLRRATTPPKSSVTPASPVELVAVMASVAPVLTVTGLADKPWPFATRNVPASTDVGAV